MAGVKESLYTAIDVGTTKVATLVARVAPAGAMEVIALGHATSEGMRKGMVVSPDELTSSVRRSVTEAESMLGAPLPPRSAQGVPSVALAVHLIPSVGPAR